GDLPPEPGLGRLRHHQPPGGYWLSDAGAGWRGGCAAACPLFRATGPGHSGCRARRDGEGRPRAAGGVAGRGGPGHAGILVAPTGVKTPREEKRSARWTAPIIAARSPPRKGLPSAFSPVDAPDEVLVTGACLAPSRGVEQGWEPRSSFGASHLGGVAPPE